MANNEMYPSGGRDVEFDDGDVPPGVRPRSFRKFNRWMDKQLAHLVTRWADHAAPVALRGPSMLRRFKLRP